MIQSIYDGMWDRFCVAVDQERYELDPYIRGANDARRGVTALAYLGANNQQVCHDILRFSDRIKGIEPQQYYHPPNELHLTVLSIITCITGLRLSDVNPQAYIDIFNEVLADIDPIEIKYQGVTASASCIVIQGFPVGSGLDELRGRLRDKYTQSGLKTSMDQRYKLITAHSSAIRFGYPLKNSRQLLSLCNEYRDHDFGSIVFSHFELVFSDWYQRTSETQSLAQCAVKYA